MSTVEVVDQRWHTTLCVTLRSRCTPAQVRAAGRILTEEADRVEAAASRFRPDSELAQVNSSDGARVDIGGLLGELIEVALAGAEASQGLVDPCLGRQVDAAGYRSWAAGEVCAVRDPATTAIPGAWQQVELGPGWVRIPAGVALDLGATAKAWLADEVAERVVDELDVDVVASMGGDLRAIARDEDWVLGADHEVPGLSPHWILVRDAGLATSGQGRRRWQTPQGPAHHLIDPRTGTSARTRWWAVSALGASATAANVAATTGMLLDSAAPAWFEQRGLDGLFTSWTGSGRASVRTVGRWPGQKDAA